MMIPSGPEGISQTLNIMRDMVRHAKKTPEIRHLALQIVGDLPQKAWRSQIEKIHAFVRDKIRFVGDVRGVETLQTPQQTLNLGQGDCDDKSTLVASLLESINHPTRFVAVAVHRRGEFEHVFVETRLGPGWITVETTEPVPLGWNVPRVLSRMVVTN